MQNTLMIEAKHCSQEYSRGETWGTFHMALQGSPVLEFLRVLMSRTSQCGLEPGSALLAIMTVKKKFLLEFPESQDLTPSSSSGF